MENTKWNQKRVYVLVGPPGSGKSTWIRMRMDPTIDTHISRDNIRFSLLRPGDAYFEVEDKVRRFFLQQIKDCTSDGFTDDQVFIDATHLTPKSRAATLRQVKNDPVKIAVSFEVPEEVAIERNAQRTGRALVPERVIRNMYDSFVIPTLDEGFDEIWHVDASGNITKEVIGNE